MGENRYLSISEIEEYSRVALIPILDTREGVSIGIEKEYLFWK
jgi:hypothetical protein